MLKRPALRAVLDKRPLTIERSHPIRLRDQVTGDRTINHEKCERVCAASTQGHVESAFTGEKKSFRAGV